MTKLLDELKGLASELKARLEKKSMPNQVNVSDVGPWGLHTIMFFSAFFDKLDKFPMCQSHSWHSEVKPQVAFGSFPGGVYQDYDIDDNSTYWLKYYTRENSKHIYAIKYTSPNQYYLYVASNSEVLNKNFIEEALIHAPEPAEVQGKRTVRFTSKAVQDGATYNYQKVDTHVWKHIRDNYTKDVAGKLGELFAKEALNEGSGKLILFSSVAGTGKTNAILAMMHEWRNWTIPYYIMDPDNFFRYTSYMMDVFTGSDVREGMYRLIILEDAGEYLRPDASNNPHSGFNKLLNITDGIAGQGQKVIVLITTNEPIRELHPAASRPGRCLANITFDKLTSQEASDWLGEYVPEAVTLAELYERKNREQLNTVVKELHTGAYI